MKLPILILIYSLLSFPLFSNYPTIKRLHKSDSHYLQLQYEINEFYKRYQTGKPSIPLSIYEYTVKKNETIFSISSILNLTYDSIVTLNGIENPEAMEEGDTLLIPNSPGIYINQSPHSRLEEIVSLRDEEGLNIKIRKTEGLIPYIFLSGSHLNRNERSFFLKTLFRKPLETDFRTSDYGFRIHPIEGKRHFHTGIDYRAPVGTFVFSSRDGVISDTGVLGNYGLYIIIKHEGGYETVYSHLNKIIVRVNDRVLSGQTIAESGNSGISTGPHLHFEIRKNGIPLNPNDFFPGDTL
ncbi:MAG: M23 family metallopeptidase [Spirochaetaceae bacterium]|nr:M23 family metallopeptidase [Spirochaetaceae bacterium]